MGRPQPRAVATTAVRLLAVSGVTLLAAACGGPAASSTAPAASTTTRPRAAARATTRPAPRAAVTESFAAGAVDPSWEAAGATVTRGDGTDGPPSWVHLVAAGTPAYVSPRPRVLERGHSGYRFTGRFRVTARAPGRTVGLATVENTRRAENADLFVDARTGRCRVDLFRADTALSPGRCDDGRWHTVTLTGDFGSATPTLAWTLDGARMPGIRSTGLPPSRVHRLWIGDATPGKTTIIDWTDLALRLR
jgi:hypothetical protein